MFSHDGVGYAAEMDARAAVIGLEIVKPASGASTPLPPAPGAVVGPTPGAPATLSARGRLDAGPELASPVMPAVPEPKRVLRLMRACVNRA